jgi:hypothetical protein
MKLCFVVILASAMAACSGDASDAAPQSQVQQTNIEFLSGPWECVDRTGVHGIFFEGSPTAPSIYVYERQTGGTTSGGYFSATPQYREGTNRVILIDHRLTIHFENSPSNRPPFDLDLVFDPARDRWSGFWSDCNIQKGVVLDRPRPLSAVNLHPLVGDWNEYRAVAPSPEKLKAILHIRQSVDEQLMTWLTNVTGHTMKLHVKFKSNAIALAPNNFFGRSSSFEGYLAENRETITGQWIREGLDTIPTVPDRHPLVLDDAPDSLPREGLGHSERSLESFDGMVLDRNEHKARGRRHVTRRHCANVVDNAHRPIRQHNNDSRKASIANERLRALAPRKPPSDDTLVFEESL